MFILNNVNLDVCADLNAFANDNFECVFVKLSSSTFKTKVLGSVYRPPNSNLYLFMSGFESVPDHFNHFGVEYLLPEILILICYSKYSSWNWSIP